MVVTVKVYDQLFELAAEENLERVKDDLLAAMRDAPAFVAFHTAAGAHASVLISATTPVVLQEQAERLIEAAPFDLHDWNDESITWGYE